MAFTPANVAQARGSSSSALLHSTGLIQIRKLFLEKRYRQCIAICEESLEADVSASSCLDSRSLITEQLHPVHQAFLLFQQAISFEALGLVAHNYSRNKIPFLESAADKFTAALEVLPPPFAGGENGQNETLKPSPEAASQNFLPNTPTPVTDVRQGFEFSDSGSECSLQSSSNYSIACSAPDFDRYSPRTDLLAVASGISRTITFPDVAKQDSDIDSDTEDEGYTNAQKSPRDPQDPKLLSRLSASLSSTHVVADDLVPSPLFSRNKKIAAASFQAPEVPTFRLPAAPYTQPNLLLVRKTAVQTLISHYEGTSILFSNNLDTPTSLYTDASLPLSTIAATATNPLTPNTAATARFATIHSIFAPQPFHPHLESYLASRSLARYNSSLSSFRTALRSAISSTAILTERATQVQEAHAEEKRRMFLASSSEAGKRMASYWLLSTPTRTPTQRLNPEKGPTENHTRSTFGLGVDEGTARGNERGRMSRRWNGQEDQTHDDATRKKRQERIEKLRESGFHVRKVRYGWKGVEYYEELRHNAERDLIMR